MGACSASLPSVAVVTASVARDRVYVKMSERRMGCDE